MHEKAAGMLADYDAARPLTRIECAQIIDALADPFRSVGIDIYGNYIHATNENPQ